MLNPSIEPVPVGPATEKHQQANRTFQGIPAIAVTPQGRVFAGWYAGGDGECPENYLVLSISDDEGRSWSDAVAVVDPPHPNVRAYDATLWYSPEGVFCLSWSQTMSFAMEDIFDGQAGVWFSTLENPEAPPESFVWTPPVRVGDGVMMNKPVALSDGTWAFPVSVWGNEKHAAAEENIGAKMIVSVDGGQSFQERGKGRLAKEDLKYDEHSFVELRDGRLWCVLRMKDGNAEMFSSDQGRTWSAPVRSSIPGPSSKLFIRQLQSGKLLLINHDWKVSDASDWYPQKREKLTAWLSEDDGATWTGRLMLDARNRVSYPDAHQTTDGRIYIIHDCDRYDHGQILMSIITEEDIAAGHLVCPQSQRHLIVSETQGIPKR